MTHTSHNRATALKQTKIKPFKAITFCIGLSMGIMHTATASPPNPPQLKPDAPHVYVVKKGDTLWSISAQFLTTPWRWTEIWAGNRHLKNPHLIYPEDRLTLCSEQGYSLVIHDQGEGCDSLRQSFNSVENRLSPQIQVEPFSTSVPIIPLSAIEVWLERYIVLPSEVLNHLPYVLGMTADRVVGTRGDRIYLRGEGLQSGQHYAIYRLGAPYSITAEDGKKFVAAVELNQVATGIAVSQKNDITTFEISHNYSSEVRKGDLVLPHSTSQLPSQFIPISADKVRAGGQVVRIMGAISNAAVGNSVAIDRGHLDGVEIGHVFAVDLKGELTTDPMTREKVQLPNQRVGHLMVYKIFDHISYGFILDSSQPIKLGAELATPYRRNNSK